MFKDPKKLVNELTALVGKQEAKRFLVDEGMSISAADKLVRQVYPSEVKLLVKSAILRALEAAKRQAS